MRDERVHQCAGGVAGGRVNDKALRLIDHDDRVVFVNDVERNGLALRGGRFRRGQRHRDDVARFDGCRGIADRAPRKRHMASKDQGLQMRAGKCRDVCSEHAVKPRACLVIGNRDCLDNTIGHGSKHV
jgi:hypothetical protein